MNIYDYVYAQDAVGTGLYVGKSEGKRGWGGEFLGFDFFEPVKEREGGIFFSTAVYVTFYLLTSRDVL